MKFDESRIVDKDGNFVSSGGKVFASRALSGSVITEDLTVAKQLFKEKIREVRKPLLDEQDVLEESNHSIFCTSKILVQDKKTIFK